VAHEIVPRERAPAVPGSTRRLGRCAACRHPLRLVLDIHSQCVYDLGIAQRGGGKFAMNKDAEKNVANVADAELKLLQVLWDRGRSTAREMTQLIYGGCGPAQIATVQKLLQRLEAKGLVRRDRSGHVHGFEAAISRSEFAGNQLEQMASRLTEGSLVPFLTHLVEAKKLSKRERDQIRRLLEESPSKKKSGERK
jgi:predicted transcriptional regulator